MDITVTGDLPPEKLTGLVEIFDSTQIAGWVRVPQGAGVQSLSLCLNGRHITAAKTSNVLGNDETGSIRRFRLRLKSLWRYTKVSDRLSITFNGTPLPIEGHGFSRSPEKNGRADSARLFAKISKGFVFNQKGRLQLSKELDQGWQDSVFALYNDLRRFMKERLEIDLIVVYGTLLGAVREGKFIGQDHDFDVAYFSKWTTPPAVKDEAKRIIHALWDAGYVVKVKKSCFYVRHPNIKGAQIDIGRMFFDENGIMQSAFGLAGKDQFRASEFDGYAEINLAGRAVLAAKNSRRLLECIYGPDWQTPNPGFHWRRERRRTAYKARFDPVEIAQLSQYAASTDKIALAE